MAQDYIASLNIPSYNPMGGGQGSYNMSELLKNQENGLSWGDSWTWNGEQTGLGGALDKAKGGFMSGGMPGSGGGGSLFGSMFDSTSTDGIKTQGWGGLALGAANTLANAYMGMKQYGLAKDTLKFNKDMFAKNFDAQKRTTNASLRDRQSARVASNPGACQSVGTYMDQNGIR